MSMCSVNVEPCEQKQMFKIIEYIGTFSHYELNQMSCMILQLNISHYLLSHACTVNTTMHYALTLLS